LKPVFKVLKTKPNSTRWIAPNPFISPPYGLRDVTELSTRLNELMLAK
jgi:hypothetical protein